jgi:hypothetical protein
LQHGKGLAYPGVQGCGKFRGIGRKAGEGGRDDRLSFLGCIQDMLRALVSGKLGMRIMEARGVVMLDVEMDAPG